MSLVDDDDTLLEYLAKLNLHLEICALRMFVSFIATTKKK